MAQVGVGMVTPEMCEIDPELRKILKAFRFRKEKTNAAIIIKIKSKDEKIVLDEQMEDVTLEEVVEELPERQPRYVHNHADGRVSFPQVFIFYSPEGCDPKVQMQYTGCHNMMISASGMTKVKRLHVEVRDYCSDQCWEWNKSRATNLRPVFVVRESEVITEEWLIDQLGFFR